MLNRASIRMQSFSVTVLVHFYFLWNVDQSKRYKFFDSKKLVSFTRTAVPFKIPILEKGDGNLVSVGVSWNGKTGIIFIDSQKTKVDQNCYTDLLETSLLLECRRLYPGNDFVFIQDSAPSKKRRNSFYDRTLQTSELLMNGHHILQILIL